MTPDQKLKHSILLRAIEMESIHPIESLVTAKNVDEIFDKNNAGWELQDARNEMRSGQVETGINCDWSRNYESKAVAAQMPDDSWVGWTYWFGGGKHSEPEAIDWMDEAYDLEVLEEEKMVLVRTFKQKATA